MQQGHKDLKSQATAAQSVLVEEDKLNPCFHSFPQMKLM